MLLVGNLNYWLDTFPGHSGKNVLKKLLVGNFYYWLETSRNFWEVLKTFLKISRNFWLETFQKLLVGNFPETYGGKLSRNFWLETFQKLMVRNFPKLLVGNFPKPFTIGWKVPETFAKY